MVKICSRLFWMLLLLPSMAMAEVSAGLNQYIVPFGQSVQLSVEAKGSVDGEPDITPLKQDFDILGQSQSSNFSMVNGSISRSKTWEYSLMPKRMGTIVVPAIAVGNEVTQVLTIKVLDESSGMTQTRDVWLDTSLSNEEVYVQAQTVLTIKLIRSVNLSQAEISEPNIDGAVLERLGDDHNYESVVDGRRVIVSERKYAIFPQQTGQLQIPPVQFDGMVSYSRSLFAQGKAIRLRSKPLSVQVLDKPASWNKHDLWLPASAVTLEETLPNGALPEYRVGEPFTRSIKLQAQGATSAQLPPLLEGKSIAGFKIYPDQPKLKQSVNKQGLLSTRIEKVAMIPTHTGTLHIPAIQVKWWDTTKKMEHTAMIAGRDIEVLPAAAQGGATSNGISQAPVQPQSESKPQAQQQTTPAASVAQEKRSAQVEQNKQTWWQWLALLFMFLWLVTLWLWWKFTKRQPQQHTQPKAMDIKPAQKAIQQACKSGDAKGVLQHLPAWVSACYQDESIQYLAQVKGLLPALDKEIEKLEQAVYAAQGIVSWSCDTLFDALQALRKQAAPNSKEDVGLKPLYAKQKIHKSK